MAIDEGILDGVANANLKTIAETPAIVANLINHNAAAHQNNMFRIAESSIGQIVNRMNTLDPTEAAAISKVSSSGISDKLATLLATTAAIKASQDNGGS